MSTGSPRPGSTVIWWDGHAPRLGLVVGDEKQRVGLLVERGKKQRIKAGRIAVEVAPPDCLPHGVLARPAEAGSHLARIGGEMRRRAAEADVELIWELVREESDAGSPGWSLARLARLAFGSDEGLDRAALLLALVEDGIRFIRKGEDWLPRSVDAVQELAVERQRIARRKRETEALFAALARCVAGEPYEPQATDIERQHVEALESLAIHDELASDATRDLALRTLHAAGQRFDRPHEGAFRLLRRTGRFEDDDENLQVPRFGLHASFEDELLRQAVSAADRGFDRSGRTDLTGLMTLAVDGPHTVEVDDLISIEDSGSGFRVGVHIADPAAFVASGDPLDLEAERRGLTFYMPDLRVPMLPPPISEHAASLVPGAVRPALSFLLHLDRDGELTAWEVERSIVRCTARLDYAQADRAVLDPELPHSAALRSLVRAARQRREARLRAGAVMLVGDEVEARRCANGSVAVERIAADSPTRTAVSEAMILTGEVAARFAQRAGVPLIHRRQTIAGGDADRPRGTIADPTQVRAVRRSLRRAEIGLEPGAHESLGLAAYAQVSSPIRRFQDLANQRQLQSALNGGAAYGRETLQRIVGSTERAESEARQAERAAREYWLLRYLEGQVGRELSGRIVDVRPRPVLLLDETLWEQPIGGLTAPEPGQTVRVRVERVNPRAGLVVLRPLD